jgi:hypothetical protein
MARRQRLGDRLPPATRRRGFAWNIPWSADGELTEYICQENNRYLLKLTDDFGQPVLGR